jgi:signal transduction histidine kinase
MQAPLSTIASGQPFRAKRLTQPGHATALAEQRRKSKGSSWNFVVADNPDHGSLFATGRPTPIAEGAGLAHDAGNLLGALGLYCDLLTSPGVLRQEHLHYAEELRLLSARSRQLIDRLLNSATTGLSRLTQGAAAVAGVAKTIQQPEQEYVLISEVVECCRGLLNTIAQRAVQVVYEGGAALPIAVPRESLERILVNLTKNAAEASQDGALITLRVSRRQLTTRPDSERVVLTLEDKGHGMSVAAVRRLMEASAVPPEGTRGLGFQVVRELVGSTGGQLRLTSESGSGTTVEIAWRVATKRSEALEPSTSSSETASDSACTIVPGFPEVSC